MLGMEMLDSDVTWPLGTSTRHTLAMVRTLEEQMYVSFEGCDRAAEERLTLEEQLRGAVVTKELAVQEAVKQVTEDAARLRIATEEATVLYAS